MGNKQRHVAGRKEPRKSFQKSALLRQKVAERGGKVPAVPRLGCVVLDSSGRICELDPLTARVLGCRRAQTLGQSFAALVKEEDQVRLRKHLRACCGAGHPVCTEVALKAPANRSRTIRLCTFPEAERGDVAPRYPTLVFDESELRQSREAVRDSESRLQLMADSLPVLISYVDANYRYRFNNAEYERWFGQPHTAYLGRTVREVVGPRAYARLRREMQLALTGRARTFEMQVPYKRVGRRDVQVDYVPHRDGQGTVAGFFALIRDITERKQAEAQLRASEKFNRAVLNSLPAHVAVVDGRGTIVAVNDAWNRFARRGGDPSLSHTGVGANYLKVCQRAAEAGERDARPILAALQSVLAGSRPRFTFEHEYPCHTPKGERWFLLFISPLATSGGGAVVSHVDITGQKLAENAALRQAQILAQVHDAVVVTDLAGTIQSWNRGAERVYGYRARDVLGKCVDLLYFPEEASTWRRLIGVLQRKPAFATTVRNRRLDGSEMYVELRLSLLRDDARRPIGVIGSCNDITGRRKAAEALRRSEANLAKAQQIAHVGSYEFNLAGPANSHWSHETFRLVGLSSARPLSPQEYVQRIVHPDDRSRVIEARQRASRHGLPFRIEYRVLLPKGGVRHVQSIGEPVFDRSGKVIRIVGTVLDISERKRLEEEILQISELEQRRIAQDLHDGLGQCLSGTRHLASVLERHLARQSLAERHEAARIVELLNEAVEQTRTLARGLYPVKPEPGGLTLALEELAARTRELFSIDCRFRRPLGLRISDNTVATHLYRIAQESISNAIRHGKARRISMGLAVRRGEIVLSVADDGPGLRASRRTTEGMGIRIMRYRADAIGASLLIRRRRTRGTQVVCRIRPPGNGYER